MKRAYYTSSIRDFLDTSADEILGTLVQGASTSGTYIAKTQTDAWLEQVAILKESLSPFRDCGALYFEYSVPRLGRRIDVLVIIGAVIFIMEFKVGEEEFTSHSLDQACDYALDLKNFHETSHTAPIAPIIIATRAESETPVIAFTSHGDNLMHPIKATPQVLSGVLQDVLEIAGHSPIDRSIWEKGRYCPTPTIVEAAMALYGGHNVEEISRNDAGGDNLTVTSVTVDKIIEDSKRRSYKSICFVTGVPGAGKTLVGLDIATKHFDQQSDLYSVYLSGNGPFVAVLREALALDRVRREKENGKRIKIGNARSEVNAFIQNVHHFRNEYLIDTTAPVEHVAIFDEAQRAWNLRQTERFMKQRGKPDFGMSEPEFLISCLDRHPDWAVIVCLVGGGAGDQHWRGGNQ